MSVDEYNKRRTFEDGQNRVDDNDDVFKTTKIDSFDVTEKLLQYGDRSQIFPTAKSRQADNPEQKYAEYAILIRRKIDHEDRPRATTVEFQSAIICACIRELLKDYPDLNLNARPIVFERPYIALFHKRKEIREYIDHPDREDSQKTHLKVLKDFLNKNLAEAEAIDSSMVRYGLIRFEWLWLLFCPGDWVLFRDQEYEECYRFFGAFQRTNNYNEQEFVVKAWGWDHNGKLFGPNLREFIIPQFVGNRRIEQLHLFPTKFMDKSDWEGIAKRLVERGRIWKRCVSFSHLEYDGIAWTDPPNKPPYDLTLDDQVPIYSKGRVVLDSMNHQQANPHLRVRFYTSTVRVNDPKEHNLQYSSAPIGQKLNLADMSCHGPEYELSADLALISPARLRGFSLVRKIWALFTIEKTSEIVFKDSYFKQLEIDPTLKHILETLVRQHKIKVDSGSQIEMKGTGLIFLLHGPPGCGKTLTAECIAELTHKPLYNINSGDLGQESDVAQGRLQSIFERAKSWNSVLLLDEADVFLAKRSAGNIARNAFVSVFLRLLEYYPGIMFLTTNRLEEFDDAFQSRIHLTIEYKDLGFRELVTIWKNNLKDAFKGKMPQGVNEKDIEALAKDFSNLNGRQIKSLISLSRVVNEHGNQEKNESLVSIIRTIHLLNEKGRPKKKVVESHENDASTTEGSKDGWKKRQINPTLSEVEAAHDAMALRPSIPSQSPVERVQTPRAPNFAFRHGYDAPGHIKPPPRTFTL
ncbi:P-loop containing nucleoside triphosphate hydrolase protein [Delitschia confertaspora ATCC 74209]|uniref:P-loop containing nucleoside triphosphate hydrolase protein n=1 Tax=Delitschia confertaspora ATCC 74209 TaxID=1513339 RepID=A0A9P4JS31_9PLEO|nr:P-loop containing nucleoside triphosphate hydrolase protein [Delitschia confertaspora ATCC 74209]